MKTRVVKISTGYVPQLWLLSEVSLAYHWVSVTRRPGADLEYSPEKARFTCNHDTEEQALTTLKVYQEETTIVNKDVMVLVQ